MFLLLNTSAYVYIDKLLIVYSQVLIFNVTRITWPPRRKQLCISLYNLSISIHIYMRRWSSGLRKNFGSSWSFFEWIRNPSEPDWTSHYTQFPSAMAELEMV